MKNSRNKGLGDINYHENPFLAPLEPLTLLGLISLGFNFWSFKKPLSDAEVETQITGEIEAMKDRNGLLPNPDVIFRYIIKRRQQIGPEHVLSGSKKIFANLATYGLCMIGFLVSTHIGMSFEALESMPSISPKFSLFLTIAIFFYIVFSGFSFAQKYIHARYEAKFGITAGSWFEYVFAKEGPRMMWQLFAYVAVILIGFQPAINSADTKIKYKELYHTNPEFFDRSRHIEKHELDEKLYGAANPILADMISYQRARNITMPGGKFLSYVIAIFLYMGMLYCIHRGFTTGSLEKDGIDAVGFLAVFLVFMFIGDLYIPSMLGIPAKNMHMYALSAAGVVLTFLYFNFANPRKEYRPRTIAEFGKGSGIEYQKSDLKFDGMAGHGKMYSISEIEEMDNAKDRERKRQIAEAERKRNLPREQNSQNDRTRKLDSERKNNDAKPDPWSRYYDRKNEKGK
jgi:hypothetical protein